MQVKKYCKMSQTLRISVEPSSRNSKKSKNNHPPDSEFASPTHNKRLDISATTRYFPTQIQPKNHLSERYRTHRRSSVSIPPFSRSLSPAIFPQRNALNKRYRFVKCALKSTAK